MAMLEKSGSSPFYKTGPLYVTEDPIDPSKKKAAEKEAKAKAEAKAASSDKVYGKSTTTQERFKDKRGTGTRTTVTTPYSQSGKDSVSYSEAYKKADKSKYRTLEEFTTAAKADKSGKDIKTSVKYDPIKTVGLKPQGIKPTTAGPKPPMPKTKTPEKPSMPTYSFSMEKQSGTTLVDKKLQSKSNLARPKKSGGGGNCGCGKY